jgi:hypothetical protein
MLVYDMELTYTFKYDMTRLNRRMRHLVNVALEEILSCPTEKPGRIFLMSTTEEDVVYRYRLPGIYLFYRIPHKRTHIIMTQLKKLKKED